MSRKSATIAVVMSLLGLLGGYFANRPATHGIAAEESDRISTRTSRSSGESTADSSTTAAAAKPISSGPHSTETLDTLTAQGDSPTYAALALWLTDASAADIAAYWEFRKANGKLDGDRMRLIFVNWTRVDPQGAIAATAGTDRAVAAWWSWAGNDPQAALAAAGPDRIKDVARGLGEFQPKWLRDHFDLIPEEARKDALLGVNTWKEEADPLAALDFLKEQGGGFNDSFFRSLVLKDPLTALDWLQKNNKLDSRYNGPLDILLETLKTERPEDLERLAAMTPSSALKWKIEDAIFASLLATDPVAARAQAKAIGAPLIAAKRLAEIGNSVLASDPEQAFEIGADILTASPDKLAAEKKIEVENGNTNWGPGDSAASKFMESLLGRDPERTLEMTIAGKETPSSAFQNLSWKWAKSDLPAYTAWVNQQKNPAIWNAASLQVVNQLASLGHFQEAAEWATSGSTSQDTARLYNLAWQWSHSNRAEAEAWAESLSLPEADKTNLRNFIKQGQ
jgi:hypothetical protein